MKILKNLNILFLLIRSSSLTLLQVKEIMTNQALFRHFKWFLKPNDNILNMRKKYHLTEYDDIKLHVLHQDPSGKTNGCGCILCSLKHYEYIQKHTLKSFNKEIKKLSFIEDFVYKKKAKLFTQNGPDYAILEHEGELNEFEDKIFDQIGGSVFRRQPKKICIYPSNNKTDVKYSSLINCILQTKDLFGTKDNEIRYNNTNFATITSRINRIKFDMDGKITSIINKYDNICNTRRKLQLLMAL